MNRFFTARLIGALAWLCLLCVQSSSAQSFFQGLGDLPTGDFFSQAWAISADGSTVVGSSKVQVAGDKTNQHQQAFRWTQQTGMVGLSFLPGQQGNHAALSVSSTGAVAVGYAGWQIDKLDAEAVVWAANGAVINLGHLSPKSGVRAVATGVSSDGTKVVGNDAGPISAFRWTAETGMRVLTALPPQSGADDVSADGTVVVGNVVVSDEFHAFRWTESGWTDLGDLPGGEFSAYARAVSGDGGVVVGHSNSANNSERFYHEAFRWTAETGMVGLGDLHGGTFTSAAWATNFDGSIVVGESTGAFIWTAQRGIQSLQDVLTNDYALNLTGWGLISAQGISADGRTIVGYGYHNGNTEAWIAHMGNPPCPADYNADGFANSQDFFDYVTAFFTTPSCPLCDQVPPGPCPADFNRDCLVNTADLFDFLAAFFAGCG